MTVGIAGGAGFIGSHLTKHVGGEVFDLRTGQDARDKKQVDAFVRDKTLVYHLANMPAHRLSMDTPARVMENNYLATLRFAEACRRFDVKMVFASSFGVYGRQPIPFAEDGVLKPLTPYGVAKKSCEELLQLYHEQYGVEIVIVRPSNVWGDGDHLHQPLQVLPIWIERVKAHEPLVVFGEKTSRDFTHVSDFVRGTVSAGAHDRFDIFNIASGKEIRLVDIAKNLSDNVQIRELPGYEVDRWQGDISKAKRLLGWEPEKDFWTEFTHYKEKRLG